MKVQTRRIPLSELRVRVPKVDRVKSSEASLRLDAVASAGFRMSRSKLADLVKSGDVRYSCVALLRDTIRVLGPASGSIPSTSDTHHETLDPRSLTIDPRP